MKDHIIDIPLSKLTPHKENKKYFHDIQGSDYEVLLQSIVSQGILTALLVMVRPGSEPEASYTVLSGHQRLRAACELGMDSLPCRLIDSISAPEALDILLHANISRRLTLAEKYRLAAHVLEQQGENKGGRPSKEKPAGNRQVLNRSQVAQTTGITKDDITVVNKIKKLAPREQEEIWAWLDSENPNKKSILKRLKQANEDKRKYKESDKQLNQLKRKAKLAKELQQAAEQIRSPQDYRDSLAIEALGTEFSALRIAASEAYGRLKAIAVPESPLVQSWIQHNASNIVELLRQQAQDITSHFLEPSSYSEDGEEYPSGGPPQGQIDRFLSYEEQE